MTVLQAPLDLSSATRVGPRTYRKQVLAKRSIDYPMPDGSTQHVDFDDAYLRDLAAAYNEGAFETVPFQLADRHTDDPKHYGGRVVGAEVTEDGLDLILELSADSAELVEKTDRRLGVSARIVPQRTADGRTYVRAIRHVLGTFGPRITGLRGWEPVMDLAADEAGPIIDLTGHPYTQEGSTMPRMLDLSTLPADQLEALESFAALTGIDLAAADPDVEVETVTTVTTPDDDQEGDEPDGDDGEQEDEDGDEPDESDDDEEDEEDGDEAEGITDDDLEALIDAELAGATVTGGDESDDLALSADDLDGDDALDLAAGLVGVVSDERQVTRETFTDESAGLRFEVAAARLARKGVPPHLIDLAAPVLALSDDDADALDLASPVGGAAVDVRAIVRDMLEASAGTIDLSSESGYGHETEPDEQVQQLASAWTEYLANN